MADGIDVMETKLSLRSFQSREKRGGKDILKPETPDAYEERWL